MDLIIKTVLSTFIVISMTFSPAFDTGVPDAVSIDGLPVIENDPNERLSSSNVRYSVESRSTVKLIDFNRTTAKPHPDSTIYGEDGTELGFSMASGDVNGDGYGDLVVGAPGYTINGSAEAGKIFVIFGDQFRSGFFSEMNITSAANLTLNGSDMFDRAGESLSVGDINGDGIGDIIIGAPGADGYNNSLNSAGEVYIIYGRTTFPETIDLKLTNPGEHQDVTIYGNDSFDSFGKELMVDDIVGSAPGEMDLIISAPDADGMNNNVSNSGEVVVIGGSDTLPAEIIIDTALGNNIPGLKNTTVIYGSAANQQLGSKLASGDLDNKYNNDLLMNSYGYGPGGSGRSGCGEVYIINGNDSWPKEIDLSKTEANATIYGQSSGDYLGFSMAVGNINFDSFDDIILGAPFADGPDSERLDAGEVYVIYGNGRLTGSYDIDPNIGEGPDVIIYGEGNGSNQDLFGTSITLADNDFDGTLDLYISAIDGKRVDNGNITGIVYLISTYHPLAPTIDLRSTNSAEYLLLGADIGDRAGFDLQTLDLDGAPVEEVALSSPYTGGYGNNLSRSGEVQILFGKKTPRPDTRGPIVIAMDPLNGSKNVRQDKNITFYFNEQVNKTSFGITSTPDPGNWVFTWDAGNTNVTMSHTDFSEKGYYRIDITSAKDLQGNEFNQTFWSGLIIETGDFTLPYIVSADPGKDAIQISPYKNITVTFSEPMLRSSFMYNITPDPGGWLAPEWDPTWSIITLKHSNPFEEYQTYRFEILSAPDVTGNPAISGTNPLAWNFSTGKFDPIMPRVIEVFPPDKGIDIPVTTYIDIQFSELMKNTSVLSGFKIDPAVPIERAEWISSRNAMRFWPEWNLEPDTTYTVTMFQKATDINGNNLDGNGNGLADGSPADDFRWSFQTGKGVDSEFPGVLTTRPESNQQDVKLNNLIEIEFSESMNKTSVEKSFEIDPYINVSFHWFFNFLTVIPAKSFLDGTTYRVTIKAGAKDTAGNPLDGDSDGIFEGHGTDDYSWEFNTSKEGTIDEEPPTIVRTLPVAGARDVAINTLIEIEFSEVMSRGMTADSLGITPSVTGSFDMQGNKLMFKPFSPLELNYLYTVRVSALARDISGRFLDGNEDGIMDGSPTDDYIFTFTTGTIKDDSPPFIINTHPEKDSVGVSRNTKIEIIFSEPMMEEDTESAFEILPETFGDFLWSENILVFQPAIWLEPNTEYTVTVSYLARDVAGNHLDGDLDGIVELTDEDNFIFHFTTSTVVDQTPPKILYSSPKDGEVDVLLTASVYLNFSEPMNKIYVRDAFRLSHESAPEQKVQGLIIWNNNVSMEFIPLVTLKPFSIYTVAISIHAQDLAGNAFDGNGNGVAENASVDNYRFSFRTGNVTVIKIGPKLVKATPADGEKNVDINQPIILEFDVPVKTEPAMFDLDVSPDPGGWILEWNENSMIVTLKHLPFVEGTEYTITITKVFDIGGFGFVEGDIPTTWKFTTKSPDENGKNGDGVVEIIPGIEIKEVTFRMILMIILISIMIASIITFITILKMRRKKEEREGDEPAGEEEEEEEETELEKEKEDEEEIKVIVDEDIEIEEEDILIEDEEEFDGEIKITEEEDSDAEIESDEDELDELPPPPPESIPTIEVEGEQTDEKVSDTDIESDSEKE